ncbi:hypothetical protein J7L06_07000 [Candidatus Bathyarchaeota archaeon]|nr:hypothetical protein [Candidatus Bathyarchaeota archaeon]
MGGKELHKFKWILVLELAFAGAYLALTRGLFVIFLVSIGYKVKGISLVMLASAAVAIVMGILIYRFPSFIVRRVKLKLVTFHGLERVMWFFIPFIQDPLTVSILYSLYMVFSFFVSTFMNFVIYGSLSEVDVKDILAKRSASGGASNIVGFLLGAFLLAFLPGKDKFVYIFSLGAALGLLSTFLITFLSLSHLENAALPKVVKEPERIFSSSLFFVTLLMGGNLLGMVWTPYVMNRLGGPDYLAALMNLIGTVSSILASLFWGGKSFKALRLSHISNVLNPLIIWLTTEPTVHIAISAFNSFTYTGASFLGSFLFAKYKEWFGAVHSSVLLATLGNIAVLMAAPIGIIAREDYSLTFSVTFAVLIASVLLSLVTVPEVAIVSEDTARTYSFVLYRSSVTGYRTTVEISKETVITTLRLLAATLVFIMLYVIYRLLSILTMG